MQSLNFVNEKVLHQVCNVVVDDCRSAMLPSGIQSLSRHKNQRGIKLVRIDLLANGVLLL